MNISSARYVISVPTYDLAPYHDYPECAFIGRSNVGKSSLINAVTNYKNLAHTSSTPGKTRLLNFFEIATSTKPFYITDLPGYGYAKTSKVQRVKWVDNSSNYILSRPQLCHVFVLMDFRHKPQAVDLEFLDWIVSTGRSFSIVLTKSDKLNQKELSKQQKIFRDLGEKYNFMHPILATSSQTQSGIKELTELISQICEDYKAANKQAL